MGITAQGRAEGGGGVSTFTGPPQYTRRLASLVLTGGKCYAHFADEDSKAQKETQGFAPGHLGAEPCFCLRCAALWLGIWPEELESLALPWVQRQVSAFHTIEIATVTGLQQGLNEEMNLMSLAQGCRQSAHRSCLCYELPPFHS